jgi:hypothetical protein
MNGMFFQLFSVDPPVVKWNKAVTAIGRVQILGQQMKVGLQVFQVVAGQVMVSFSSIWVTLATLGLQLKPHPQAQW